MAYRVVIAEPAERSIDEAARYIADVLSSPAAASSLLDVLEEQLRLLADMPLAFGVNDFVSDAVGKEMRRCPVKGYGIYYLVNDEEKNRVRRRVRSHRTGCSALTSRELAVLRGTTIAHRAQRRAG